MTVGRRPRHRLSAKIAGGAWLVPDYRLLAPDVGEPRRDEAAANVGRDAGRKRHDEADKPCRPRLRAGGAPAEHRRKHRCGGRCGETTTRDHGRASS
jgi:hypothetical protein